MSNDFENHDEFETQENLEDADIDWETQDDTEPLGSPEDLEDDTEPLGSPEDLEDDADDADVDPVLERLVEETEKGWHGHTTSRQRLSLGSNYDAVMARINKA